MKNLELNKDLYHSIIDWMMSKGYSNNTLKTYSLNLKKIMKNHNLLDRDAVRSILKRFKYQNQRAVLCIINNYCFDNSIDFYIPIPKMKAQPRKIPEILSLEEIKIMINSAPKPYDLAIRCIFNMGAGLRVSEIIRLSWNHIRWANWINDQEGYGVAIIKSAKGNKDRVVNIPAALMRDLYSYAKDLGLLNEFRIPVGGMIFKFETKEYKPKLRTANLEIWKWHYIKHCYNWFRYNIIHLHCEKALGKRIKIHELRHSRATYLYEIEKVPIERIGLLLGHSDLSTTRIYTKVNPISTFEMMKNTKEI